MLLYIFWNSLKILQRLFTNINFFNDIASDVVDRHRRRKICFRNLLKYFINFIRFLKFRLIWFIFIFSKTHNFSIFDVRESRSNFKISKIKWKIFNWSIENQYQVSVSDLSLRLGSWILFFRASLFSIIQQKLKTRNFGRSSGCCFINWFFAFYNYIFNDQIWLNKWI